VEDITRLQATPGSMGIKKTQKRTEGIARPTGHVGCQGEVSKGWWEEREACEYSCGGSPHNIRDDRKKKHPEG